MFADLPYHIARFKLNEPILAEDALTFSNCLLELLLWLLQRLKIFGFYVYYLT